MKPGRTMVPALLAKTSAAGNMTWWKNVIALTVVGLVALGIRVWFNLRFVSPGISDEPSLFQYAMNVVHGKYYGTNGAYWPPGFIFFMGFLFRIWGPPVFPHFLAARMVQSLLGALTATLVFTVAQKMFRNSWVAFLAGVLYALEPSAIFYTGLFLSETLWVFLLFLSLWLTYRSMERRSFFLHVLTGIAFGLAALTRPTVLPLAALAVFHLYWNSKPPRHWGRDVLGPAACILGAMLLTILPWTVRNMVVTGEPVFIDINAGINMYLAHNPKSTGQWVDMGADDPVLRLGNRPEVDTVGTREAVRYMLQHPQQTLQQAEQVNQWFWTRENSDVEQYGPLWLRAWQTVYSFRRLAVLGLAGVLLSLRRWRRTLWVILFLAGYTGLIDFLYYAPRYRFAVEPLLALFAARTFQAFFPMGSRVVTGSPVSGNSVRNSSNQGEEPGRIGAE